MKKYKIRLCTFQGRTGIVIAHKDSSIQIAEGSMIIVGQRKEPDRIGYVLSITESQIIIGPEVCYPTFGDEAYRMDINKISTIGKLASVQTL